MLSENRSEQLHGQLTEGVAVDRTAGDQSADAVLPEARQSDGLLELLRGLVLPLAQVAQLVPLCEQELVHVVEAVLATDGDLDRDGHDAILGAQELDVPVFQPSHRLEGTVAPFSRNGCAVIQECGVADSG